MVYPVSVIVTALIFIALIINTAMEDFILGLVGLGVPVLGAVVYYIFDLKLKKKRGRAMNKILYNAKVYMEKGTYAQAVLVEDGYIKDVGSNEEILGYKDECTQFIDCEGKTLIPGLNDSHLHLMQFGESLNQVQIEGFLVSGGNDQAV